MTNIIDLININQEYKKSKLFDNFCLSIEDAPNKGQFIALMGPSGCGKSTILRYITGLQVPTSGEILVNGKKEKPAIPMVFQQPSSLEWYSVLDNIALPLILKGVGRKQAREQAMEMVKTVGLEGHEKKWAKSPGLSGGQLQRVAIARSLVANPNMIVLDEPFSALDLPNRRKMQDFLFSLFTNGEIAGYDPTIILVTHDASEAIYLANDIIIMELGKIKIRIKVDIPSRDRKSTHFAEAVNYIETNI